MNWDRPEERLALLESVGAPEYNRQHVEHVARTTLVIVNGYGIRPVHTRFGLLYAVAGTGMAFSTQEQAARHASGLREKEGDK